jgi:hypothetical protein
MALPLHRQRDTCLTQLCSHPMSNTRMQKQSGIVVS